MPAHLPGSFPQSLWCAEAEHNLSAEHVGVGEITSSQKESAHNINRGRDSLIIINKYRGSELTWPGKDV